MLTDLIPPELYEDEPLSMELIDRGLDPVEGKGYPEVTRWCIDDDGSAEWAMAHLAAIHAELDTLALQAEAWRDRIAAWLDHRARPLGRRAAFFAERLEDYALRVREEKGINTLSLPSGTVPTRQLRAKWDVVDEAAYLTALREVVTDEQWDEATRTTVAPVKAAIGKVGPMRPATVTTFDLACGCRDSVPRQVAVGEVLHCTGHGSDEAVADVVEERIELRYVDVNGEGTFLDPVPGVAYVPPSIKAEAKPA